MADPLIRLPWPDKALSPNARHGHWGSRARAVKAARTTACYATLAAAPAKPEGHVIRVTVTYHPPGHYRFDKDNLDARMKAYLDGIADGLRVNDHRFDLRSRIVSVDPHKVGFVTVEIGSVA